MKKFLRITAAVAMATACMAEPVAACSEKLDW